MPNENKQHPNGNMPPMMPPPPPPRRRGRGPNPYHNGTMSPKNSRYFRDDSMQQPHHSKHHQENPKKDEGKRTIAEAPGFEHSKYSRSNDMRPHRRPPVPAMPPVPMAPMQKPKPQAKQQPQQNAPVEKPVIIPDYDFSRPRMPAVKPTNEGVQLASYEKSKSNFAIKAVIVNIVLLISAVLLEFIKLKFSFIPSFMSIDLAIFPEYICLLFYGPLVAVPLILLKNIGHSLIFYVLNGSISYVGELSNIIRDIVFIMIAFLVYRYFINSNANLVDRTKRRVGVLVAGTVSTVATAFITLPVMNSIIYPLFTKYFEAKDIEFDILGFYVEKMDSIDTIWQGLLIFNLPVEIVKLITVTIVATIIYAIATAKE